MSDDLDFDALEATYNKRQKSAPAVHPDDLDFDALEKAHADTRAHVQSVPLTPERQAKLDAQIKATQLSVPSRAGMLGQALTESTRTAASQFNDQALFGIPGRALRALGNDNAPAQPIPTPGKRKLPEDYVYTPNDEKVGVGVLAGGTDLAALGGAFGRAGQAIGQAPASLARAFGAREAQAAVRPGIQALADSAATGALYSGADTAMRGGSPGEVLSSLPEGAAAGALMSQLPAAAEGADRSISKRVVANDLRPIKQMSKKGTLDKELIQFGAGDPEKGSREMADFVQRENLGPILRQKGAAAVNQYESAKDAVYQSDLKPIYEHAYAVEPDASVPFDQIASNLRGSIRKRGGNEHRLVEQAIDEIKKRTDLVSSNGNVPLETLLTNARDFQSAGHAGVVNYDAPPESKVVMRQVGHTLRAMANERVAAVYRRNPEAAQELFTKQEPTPMGMTYRDQPTTPTMARAEDYPNAWARRYQNAQEYAADVPRLLAEGNKRFSDYAKLEPLVRQASIQKAGEKKHGLLSYLGHGASGTVGGVAGYAVGGFPGAIAGTAAVEGGRAAYPYVLRGAGSLARGLGGPAVGAPAGLAGALSLPPLEDRERD